MSMLDLIHSLPQGNSYSDLFLNNLIEQQANFVNPIITEREQGVFKLFKPLAKKVNSVKEPTLKKKGKKSEINNLTTLSNTNPSLLHPVQTVTTESISKKVEKKRKYKEINKEINKKLAEKQNLLKQKKLPCFLFLKGRCNKGSECLFVHDESKLNKKYELCKHFLNGYCNNNENCLYMHSDFPCKYFHRIDYQTGKPRNDCTFGEKCRFSHEPITNPLIKEALENYLKEEDSTQNKSAKRPRLDLDKPEIMTENNNKIQSLMDIQTQPNNNLTKYKKLHTEKKNLLKQSENIFNSNPIKQTENLKSLKNSKLQFFNCENTVNSSVNNLTNLIL